MILRILIDYRSILEFLDDEEIFKSYINDPRLDFSCKNTIFQSACRHGHLDVIKSLIIHESVDPAGDCNEAISAASEKRPCRGC